MYRQVNTGDTAIIARKPNDWVFLTKFCLLSYTVTDESLEILDRFP